MSTRPSDGVFRPTRRTINTLLGLGSALSLTGGRSAQAAPRTFGLPPTPFQFVPFTRDLPLPAVKQPLLRVDGPDLPPNPPFVPGQCLHGIAPEFHTRPPAWQRHPLALYELEQRESVAEILPGVQTPIWGYDGQFPGPTLRSKLGEPFVVRLRNNLPRATSVHLHGGHQPSHADGYPNFYVQPGEARDYYYPNISPLEPDGSLSVGEAPSTIWYHDHSMDETAENVTYGLAGFYLQTDELEDQLVADRVLPGGEQDVPLCIQDRRFNADGSLYFDPLDHDGYLGDVFIVNGVAQPRFRVQRRKYRFRLLDGANARYFLLRLSSGGFLRLSNDGVLLPNAQATDEVLLCPGKRADVVIDFRNAPGTVYLQNHIRQDSGRGPHGTMDNPARLDNPVPLLRFDVVGPPVDNDASVAPGTPLRPFTAIQPQEVVATRRFRLGRSNGAWQINGQFFDEFRAQAIPTLGTAERWIFENSSGGWWHPMHLHLETHQVVRRNGGQPRIWERFTSDLTILGPNDTVEILSRFRTFTGPFVFHCHATEHEDMRMMLVFDVRPPGASNDPAISQYHP